LTPFPFFTDLRQGLFNEIITAHNPPFMVAAMKFEAMAFVGSILNKSSDIGRWIND